MGAEGAVNSITRGSFSLSFSSEAEFGRIGWCSALLTTQFIAQLLLISQASLFGQILFVASLGVSWVYNSYLTSLHKNKIQRSILFDSVLEKPVLNRYALGTFTSAVVFSLLFLRPKEPMKLLDELLPDTNVWGQWKQRIVRDFLRVDSEKAQPVANGEAEELAGEDKNLFDKLYKDAEAAHKVYRDASAKLGERETASTSNPFLDRVSPPADQSL